MCFNCHRNRLQSEYEEQQKQIQERLITRVEMAMHRPPNEDDMIWEFVWMSQIPYMKAQAEKVYPLFTDLCKNDFSLYEDEMRFHFAHRQAARDLAKYIASPHENCPLLWVKQQWINFIRKLFHRALRHFPRPGWHFPEPPRSSTPSSRSSSYCCSDCDSD